jgi:hypothetical protein
MNKNNYSNYKEKKINVMWNLEGFAIGFQISKPHKCTGWNWYVSVDFTFLSIWWYF